MHWTFMRWTPKIDETDAVEWTIEDTQTLRSKRMALLWGKFPVDFNPTLTFLVNKLKLETIFIFKKEVFDLSSTDLIQLIYLQSTSFESIRKLIADSNLTADAKILKLYAIMNEVSVPHDFKIDALAQMEEVIAPEDAAMPYGVEEEKRLLLTGILQYYSQEAQEILLWDAMTVEKISVILPLLWEQALGTQELRLIANTDVRAIKWHLRQIMKTTRKNALAVVQPLTLEEWKMKLYFQLRIHVLDQDWQTSLRELKRVIDSILDVDVIQVALSMKVEKIIPLWEILDDFTDEQLRSVYQLDTSLIERHNVSLVELSAEGILALWKREMGYWRTLRNTMNNVAHRVKAHLETKVAQVEELSVTKWNTLKNSFNLKIHKHTLEAILHYIQTSDTVAMIQPYSSSFYKAYDTYMKNGKLAQVIKALGIKLDENLFSKSPKSIALIGQLMSIWATRCVPVSLRK